jgi:hypothetical protein
MPASNYQGEVTLLRQIVAYDDSTERHQLDARITQAQRDERCVRRAVVLMGLLAVLAAVGLGYAAVLLPHHPLDMSRFFSRLIVQVLCVLGLTALGCLLAFLALDVIYRIRLDARREECRRLATKVIESRLGRPRPSSGRRDEPVSVVMNLSATPSPE